MKVFLWLALGLFVAKLVWNLGVPYMLGIELLRAQPGTTRTGGTSVVLWIDVSLILLIGLLSSQARGDTWIYGNGLKMVGAGIGAFIVSAVHFVAVSAVFGVLASRRNKGRQ